MGVCGGIATYKSAELVRLLTKQNIDVRVIMTYNATQFVSPLTFQALSGHPVATELLDSEQENAMGHIHLARWADTLIIAPATANMMAKLCYGLADDYLSTLYLAATCPVYIAPAMNQAMWNKTITQENVQRLKNQGVHIIGPESGTQACGETGLGRMAEAVKISQILTKKTDTGVLQGLNVLISAGPTREPLDPVRYITNRSSGKMGYALATAALNAGAKVTLVSGPVVLTPPDNVELINVESAEQMYQAVISRATHYTLYIGAAAVADYTPVTVSTKKLKKQAEENIIRLQKTKDVLADVAVLKNRPDFVVGFAAETNDLEYYAKNKLKQKNLDMIAANWVGKEQGGFESEDNSLQVYWDDGHKILTMTNKTQLAEQLIALIAERMNEKNTN